MKTKNTFTVIFFTKNQEAIPKQLSIYVHITVDSKRVEISLKRSSFLLLTRYDYKALKNTFHGAIFQLNNFGYLIL